MRGLDEESNIYLVRKVLMDRGLSVLAVVDQGSSHLILSLDYHYPFRGGMGRSGFQ